MRIWMVFLVLGAIGHGLAAPLQIDDSPKVSNETREVEEASARVEQVYNIEDDGFQQIHYVVHYHGKLVVVEDPLCRTDYSVGDKIYFLVMRHDMSKDREGGKKLLHFMVR